MSVVPGDPGSVSACASTARAVGRALSEQASGVRTAYAGLGEGWTGHASVRGRRAGHRLAEAADDTAAELDRVGQVLQDHATDLADLVARGRAVEEQARASGLEVRNGRVELAWGVSGAADEDRDRAREASRIALQSELALVLAQHERRRDWVLGVLRRSTTTLADVSHALREG